MKKIQRKRNVAKKMVALLGVLLSVVFTTSPVDASAEMKMASGNMGDTSVAAYVSVESAYGNAETSCQSRFSDVYVSLTYYYVDESCGTVIPMSTSRSYHGSVSVNQYKPNGNTRSYKSVSYHRVNYNEYQWEKNLEIYY